ncbi:MAG TPA: hypothetical protein VF598_11565, partial [Hymenobacter sp.]
MRKTLRKGSKQYVILIAFSLMGVAPAVAGSAARTRVWQGQGTLTQGQDSTVSKLFIPVISDENYEPLAGVEVFGRRGALSAVTDALGQVRLAASKGDTLQLRAFGTVLERYVVQDDLTPLLLLSTKNPVVARLKPVHLIYTDARRDLTASSTQTIYNRDLQRLPVASFLNALVGRVAGMTTNQNSGQP